MKNRWIEPVLLQFARGADAKAFWPVSEGVRRFYFGPLRLFVQGALGSELIVRHSVAEGSGFNPFLSDVDFTVILKSPFSLRDTDAFLDRYSGIKRLLPMLGEVEIFSPEEWEELFELRRSHGRLLSFVRDLKKVRWMEWALASPRTSYHVYKQRRAIRRILTKHLKVALSLSVIAESGNLSLLAEPLSKFLQSYFVKDEARSVVGGFAERELVAFSRELDATIGSDLRLDPLTGLVLLSLLPSHYDESPEIQPALVALRGLPGIRALHVIFLKEALIYAHASPRVHIQYRGVSGAWTARLTDQLRKWASPDEASRVIALLNSHD